MHEENNHCKEKQAEDARPRRYANGHLALFRVLQRIPWFTSSEMLKGVRVMLRHCVALVAVCSFGFALATPVSGQDSAPAKQSSKEVAAPFEAKALLLEAQQKAKKEHKPLFVLFDASW